MRAARPLARRWRDVLRASVVPLVLIGAGFGLGLDGYRINLTESMPRGVWRTTHDLTDAQFVAFCVPERYRGVVRERGYIGAGDCDGLAPLVKPIVARAGDQVMVGNALVIVNDVAIAASSALAADTQGRPLAPFPPGRYTVGVNELWVVSTHHARSLDSRYFGPIAASDVKSGLAPVWVW
jgi:conjugative transfer signal peptidase TraF